MFRRDPYASAGSNANVKLVGKSAKYEPSTLGSLA